MNVHDAHHKQALLPILQHPGTFATVLYGIGLRYFGEDIHHWDPETVWLEFRDEFGIDLPATSHDRLMALITAVSTNTFYRDWATFSIIAHTLNGDDQTMGRQDSLLPAMMAWAVTEVRMADEAKHEFGVDVAVGVGKILSEDGFTKPPAQLSFAKIDERYEGSDSPGETGHIEAMSTEHAAVVQQYMIEQASTLIRQVAALPWQTPQSIGELVQELQSIRG